MALPSASEKRALLAEHPDLPKSLVQRHIAQLDNDYFQEFDFEAICEHVRILDQIDENRRFHLRFENLGAKACGLTLLGLDYRGFLAALTGLLSGLGYEIKAGRAFTCTRQAGDGTRASHIIDFLIIEHPHHHCLDPVPQEVLTQGISALFSRLASGDQEGLRSDLISRLMERRQGGIDAQNPASELMRDGGLPLDISFESQPHATRLTVRGKDRQALLFCLSLGLSLQNVSILKMMAAAEGRDIGDQFVVVNARGEALASPEETEPLRVTLLLMERYLWALAAASDITSALKGLNRIIQNWLPDSRLLAEGFGIDPTFLPALARVLSAGPHLWDQVLAMGPEAFKRLLDARSLAGETSSTQRKSDYAAALAAKFRDQPLDQALADWPSWRHQEILKIELDFLLDPESRVEPMSEALADLAEAGLQAVVAALIAERQQRYGDPGPYALFALGKFGGREMGTGSDLELLWLHAQAGESEQAPQPIRYGEYHGQLARALQTAWNAPQGTTLALDWRLRPHGDSGPMAAHGEVWREYVMPGGAALDFERQALLRLRPLFGDPGFIAQVMQWRDEAVFRNPPLPIEHTLELRAQQVQLKTKPAFFHVKFSPGALVDIEYAVQFLQLRQGHAHPHVRQASTSAALECLLEAGILTLGEFEHLYTAYLFYRRLQAHLRLTRGLSKDLETPAPGSLEYRQLALRLGFTARPEAKAEQQLEWEIRRTREAVSGFFEHRFRGGKKPEALYASLALSLMDPMSTLEEAEPALRRLGMRDFARARQLFWKLFDCVIEKRLLSAVLLVAEERFLKSPDPEYALQQFVRYLENSPHPDVTVRQLLHHPPLMQALLALFGQSIYLGDILIRESQWLKEIMRPGVLTDPKDEATLRREAAAMAEDPTAGEGVAERLCRFRDREYVRIALRDVYLNVHLQQITRDISQLSNILIAQAAESAFKPYRDLFDKQGWAVIAMGKLGGGELNYSSDIDLIFIREGGEEAAFDACARELVKLLGANTGAGRLFRVDMNLRPWGKQGYLTGTGEQYLRYYQEEAQGWELQAWLKARTVAGGVDLGPRFIKAIRALALDPTRTEAIAASMLKVRHMSLEQLQKKRVLAGEVKLGPGGIRTVEFFAQAQQIRHGHALPEIITGNTLEALGRLQRFQVISPSQYQILSSAYVFLRRVEHRLQLLRMQQEHELPTDPAEMEKLARRMGYEPRFGQEARITFLEHYRKHMFTLLSVSESLFKH